MRFDPKQPISDTNSPYLESAEYSFNKLINPPGASSKYLKYYLAYWEHKMWWQILLHYNPSAGYYPHLAFAEKEMKEYLNL